MPAKFGVFYEDDDLDRQMRADGFIPAYEAAQHFGWEERTIGYRAADGDLQSQNVRGRLFVSARSVQSLLRSQGPGTVSHEIERCLQAGEYQRAQELYDASDPVGAQISRMYGGMVDRSPSASTAKDLPDPVDEFIRASQGGK